MDFQIGCRSEVADMQSLAPYCCLVLIFSLLTGCEKPIAAQTSMKTGFWVWSYYGGSDNLSNWSGNPLDYIYFQAGELPVDRPVWAHIPSVLPTAHEYWAVFRSDSSHVPSKRSAELLGDQVADLIGEARIRGMKLSGIQLDIDVSSRSLKAYAEWLRLVKAELPPEMQLSVTGLLTWFETSGVDAVVAEVDEFVPQFYDLGDTQQGLANAIGAPIDAAKWGPIFNKFRKRYRIGIATFGRARMISSSDSWFLNYISPIDIASSSAFQAKSRHIDTGENVVEFRAIGKASFGYNEIQPGQTIRFTLPTIESVRAGVTGAAKMGGFCGGGSFSAGLQRTRHSRCNRMPCFPRCRRGLVLERAFSHVTETAQQ